MACLKAVCGISVNLFTSPPPLTPLPANLLHYAFFPTPHPTYFIAPPNPSPTQTLNPAFILLPFASLLCLNPLAPPPLNPAFSLLEILKGEEKMQFCRYIYFFHEINENLIFKS